MGGEGGGGGGGRGVEGEKKQERREYGESGVCIHMATPGNLIGGGTQATRQGRPGNVIQGGCLNMTSLGDIQSAAKPSSGASPGTVASKVTTVSSLPVNPTTPSAGKIKIYDGRRERITRMKGNIFIY